MDAILPEAHSFATTRWSLVLAAGSGGSAALGALCRSYWHPLYAFARRLGHTPHDAEDLTQGFLADLLARSGLSTAMPSAGRFRTFLLASLKNFVADQRDRARALKRGGGRIPLSLDDNGESFLSRIADERATPEAIFDRSWAIAVVERALERVRAQYVRQPELFEALRPMLTGDAGNHAGTADSVGLSEGAVKVALHRMRRRYGEALRAEVAETVSDPAEVESELRHLLSVLGG